MVILWSLGLTQVIDQLYRAHLINSLIVVAHEL